MMTRFQIARLAAAGIVLAACAGAHATDTQNLSVTATVQAKCKFTSSAQTLSFNIDPSSGSAAAGTMSSTVTYKCSNGTTPTITADNGANYAASSRRMKDTSATPNYLPYSLTVTGGGAGTGFGSGQDKNVAITGSVAVTDFENAAASTTYADTVQLTLNP